MSAQLSPLEQLAQVGQQQQQAPAPSDLSPLEQLAQVKPEAPAQPGAEIQPVTTSTNPKLAAAEAGKDMPEYVGAVGALGAGAMGTAIAQPAVDAAVAHLGGLTKIVQAAKNLGWGAFTLKEAHDLYKMVTENSKK